MEGGAPKESEERFRATFENAAVGIAHVAPDGTWLLANRRLCEIIGYLAEELLGIRFQDITHPDDREADLAQLQRIQAGEIDSYSREKRYLRKDRTMTWVRSSMSALRKTDRSIAYLIKVIEDISEKKAAEIALQEREAQLRLALEAGRLGTWRWDIAQGTDAVQADARCWALFGLPSDTAPTSQAWGRVIPAEDTAVAKAAAARAIDPADACDDYACEYRAVHPDGTVVWLSAAGRVVFEADPTAAFGRRPLFMTGTLRDVTAAHQVEEMRKEREKRARYFPELEKQLQQAPTANEALYAACKMLGRQLGAIFAAVELEADSEQDVVESTWSAGDLETRLARWRLSDSGYRRTAPLLAGKIVTICDVSADPRTADEKSVQAVYQALGARSSIEVPLMRRGRAQMLMFVADAVPRTWTKAEIALVRKTINRVWQVVERMHAEAALRESEERFRGIFENAATGIAILDLQNGFLSCNPAYCQMLGYTNEELGQFKLPELVHPEDRETNLSQYQRMVTQKIRSFEIVNRYLNKAGKPIWVHKYVSLLRDATGKPTNILVLVTDITARKHNDDQIRLLMREVNHRSKNLLAVVQAIARQTLAANPEDFLDRFGKRVAALAASQDLLTKNEWKGANLHDVVRYQVAPFDDLIGTQIRLQGRPLFVSASAAQVIGMAVHELATNAGKYGALSSRDGCVEIGWSVRRDETNMESFIMTWRERCPQPITPPAKQGFGSFVVGRMAEMSFGAKVEISFPPTGLTWQLRCAAEEVLDCKVVASPPVEAKSPTGSRRSTSRRPRILIVEDEALVAIEIADALIGAGFDVVGPARNAALALDLLRTSGCDAAVLDINLGHTTAEAIAVELTANNTPFVTLSGYSSEQLHTAFRGAPALKKPLRLPFLIAELRKCFEQSDGCS